MLIFTDLVLLMTSLTGVFASKGVLSLYALLKLSPQVALIALGPVLNLILIALVVNLFRLAILLSNLLAKLQLHCDSLMSFFLLFLFLLNLLVDKRFESIELLGLAIIGYIITKVLFSRFLKISVCSALTLFLEH